MASLEIQVRLLSQLLNLDRPLAFFDLETTGLSTRDDRIIDIAILKIDLVAPYMMLTRRLNPGIAIPPITSAVHGIKDRDVASAPTFQAVAGDLVQFLRGCDLAGFNVRQYDLPLLQNEFQRASVSFDVSDRAVLDAMVIYHTKEPYQQYRTLSAAVRYYCGRQHEGAHSAEADTRATLEVLVAQLNQYLDLPREIRGLHTFCNTRANFR